MRPTQGVLFEDDSTAIHDRASSTFVANMSLPVHRWFRYSAGFSAEWVSGVIRHFKAKRSITVLDPFAGSATTLIAAEGEGVPSWGIDSHPFVSRIARAKLQWRSDPEAYAAKIRELRALAKRESPSTEGYSDLIYKCYDDATLRELDCLRRAYERVKDDSIESELVWLTLIAILRTTSHAGTAQWQYILPRKRKRAPKGAFAAFDACARMIRHDMIQCQSITGPQATFLEADARTCAGVPDGAADLVITSPPYPNNYDYADATRLEMTFMREIGGWGDLQESVRRHLIRSCTQHVPERAVDLPELLRSPELAPVRQPLSDVCDQLAEVRKTKGGKKTYHLMVACYFRDLAQVWMALRRACSPGAQVCFVIGDSAPYGVYVPVIPWLWSLAEAAGFKSHRFERTRERNVKWKNRKHRVPLQEGRLWIEG
ncbi:MAG TPA: hypothetical protein VMP01_16300 [Pirellulaceae bacterium]|nr:hypothetical protein [Pirellulaceae bacterium]